MPNSSAMSWALCWSNSCCTKMIFTLLLRHVSIKCFNWDKEIESFCNHFKIDVHRYTYDIDTKTLTVKSVHEFEFDNVMNVISECEYDEEHIMYCKDITKLSLFNCAIVELSLITSSRNSSTKLSC